MFPPTWTIRPATVQDIDSIIERRFDMFRSMNDNIDEAKMETLRQPTAAYLQRAIPSGEFCAWLAESEGQVIGSAAVILHAKLPGPRNPSGREGYILSVYVNPAWRRQGIATALMNTILEYLRQNNVGAAYLHASSEGRLVYEQLGFESVPHAMRLYLNQAKSD
jgi:GNAT superfamily N-acetyltransferase